MFTRSRVAGPIKQLNCIGGQVKKWSFPAPKDGGIVRVVLVVGLKSR